MIRPYLIYIVNIMVPDVLAMQGAKAEWLILLVARPSAGMLSIAKDRNMYYELFFNDL